MFVPGDEDVEEKDEEGDEDEGTTEGPAEGAAYWVSLLSSYSGKLRDVEQEEMVKPLRKRNRTERAAAAMAGALAVCIAQVVGLCPPFSKVCSRLQAAGRARGLIVAKAATRNRRLRALAEENVRCSWLRKQLWSAVRPR